MNKIKYILLLLTCLFLTGCENYYLDYNTIDCSLDKSSYRTDENIVLSCEGCFAENNCQGDLTIDLCIHKIVNGETVQAFIPIKIVDNGNLKKESIRNGFFSAYIQENADFKEVNEKITLSISDYEAGEYELHVIFESYVNHVPFEQERKICLNFVVTEE